jgi:hypothetical protein
MGRPPLGVHTELAACQIPSETLAGQERPELFADIVKRVALVTIAALEGASVIPAATEPGLRTLKPEPEFIPGGVLITAAGFVHGCDGTVRPAGRAGSRPQREGRTAPWLS